MPVPSPGTRLKQSRGRSSGPLLGLSLEPGQPRVPTGGGQVHALVQLGFPEGRVAQPPLGRLPVLGHLPGPRCWCGHRLLKDYGRPCEGLEALLSCARWGGCGGVCDGGCVSHGGGRGGCTTWSRFCGVACLAGRGHGLCVCLGSGGAGPPPWLRPHLRRVGSYLWTARPVLWPRLADRGQLGSRCI